MLDPKEPLEFSDMSDYPQNGWGMMDVDRPEPRPLRWNTDEVDEDEQDNWPLEDGHFEGDL